MTKDWRLERLEAQEYLRGVTFVQKTYRAYSSAWEHDHCVACWQKLTEPDAGAEDAVHEGSATTDEYPRGAEYEWVCVPCFELFAGHMGWRDATERTMN